MRWSTTSASLAFRATTGRPPSRRSRTCPRSATTASASRRKLAGFTGAAERAGISVAPVEHALFSLEGGQAATTRMLRQGVTGIICASDVLALGAIRGVRRAGLAVPGDVSVVGYAA